MGTRINAFPFFDPSDEEIAEEGYHTKAALGANAVIRTYGKDGGAEIAQMLACEGIPEACAGLAVGLANSMWSAWRQSGFPVHSQLSDEILERALVWVGVAMRQAFIAGLQCGQQGTALEELRGTIEDADIRGLGGNDDVG